MTDLVYVAYSRSDYDAVRGDENHPCPYQPNGLMAASVVPRRGDFVHGDGMWWRVDVVAWSAYRQPHQVGLSEPYHAWVDISVTPVAGDPRQPDT